MLLLRAAALDGAPGESLAVSLSSTCPWWAVSLDGPWTKPAMAYGRCDAGRGAVKGTDNTAFSITRGGKTC